MALLTDIEKGVLVKLFNRDGYVLDFSTPNFNAFTFSSIGEPLCQKYGVSKGASLCRYIAEASDANAVKLLVDLFDYYELTQYKEIEGSSDYALIYKRCKPIVDRVKAALNQTAIPIDGLKEMFSSEYISTQLDIMLKMQEENPTEAIGKSKELIESCCKTILEKLEIEIDKKWDVVRLVDETVKLLKVTPRDISDNVPEATAIKTILGNLKNIAVNVATLRNVYGSGHGKTASYKGLEPRHAKLAVGSSITLVNFLWDSYERQLHK